MARLRHDNYADLLDSYPQPFHLGAFRANLSRLRESVKVGNSGIGAATDFG